VTKRAYSIAGGCWRGVCWVARQLNANNAIITAIATVAIGIVAWLQWETFEKTDRTLNKTLLVGQRAFVHLEGISLEVADNWVSESESNSKITVFNAPRNMGKMIRSKFSLTNAGNTPTKSLSIMIHCQLVGLDRKVVEPFDLLKWNEATVIRRSLGAKQTITVSTESCDFKNNDVLLNAQMSVVPVFLTGEITYEDWIEPGTVHRTQFAHRLVVNDYGRDNGFAGMNVTTEPTGAHNCTDEDCPQ